MKRIDKQIFRHECKTKLHYLVPLEMVTKELVGFKREGETLYGVHICQESDAGLGEYGNNWVNVSFGLCSSWSSGVSTRTN